MKKITALFIMSLLASPAHSGSKPYSFNLNAGILYDDNVGRAVLSQDLQSDTIFNLGASASYSFPQHHSMLTLTAGIDHNSYQDFDRLSNTLLSTRVDYEIQPDHGFTSPWYLLSLEYTYADYDSALRNGNGFSIEMAAGKRITDLLSIRAGLVFDSFSADAREFDTDDTRIYLSTDYKTSNENIVYLTLAYTDGNTTTSTTDSSAASKKIDYVPRYGHHLPGEVNFTPLRSDDAFRDGFVYQLETESISLQLGDNYALSSHQSIDASVFYFRSDSFGSETYDGMILQLSYLHQF